MAENEHDEGQIRAYWNMKAEAVETDENIADFLAHLRIVDHNTFQVALPTLCIVSARENLSDGRKKDFEDVCAGVLIDPESTRPSRRAVLACLKEFRSGPAWTDFYTLVEALDEPQFHIIRPILPRFDSLLLAVSEKKIGFVWAKIALLRAIVHTNGWIRAWAIEKSVFIEPQVLRQNHEFITSLLIPHLNNNDVFWRHLEKTKMLELLSQLSTMLEAVKSTPGFLRNLLSSIELLSCPTAIFFIVSALENVSCEEILNAGDVTLMRRVVLRARYIPHKSMRIVTIRNLVIFYAKVTEIEECVLDEFANLVAYFSRESTQNMIDSTFVKIEEVLKSRNYHFKYNEVDFELKFPDSTAKNIGEHAKIWWIASGEKQKMLSRLQLEVAESLSDRTMTTHLFLLKEKPESVECSSDVLECMKNELGEYIVTRIISNTGSKYEFQLLHQLYIPLFLKYCRHMVTPFALAIVKILAVPRSCESAALLLTFFDVIVEQIPENHVHELAEDFAVYLGGSESIGMGRQKKTIDEYDTKEFNHIVATLHSFRIKLLNKFTSSIIDPSVFLLECIEQLDVASAFSVKQQICRLIARFIPDCSDNQVSLQCIRAAANIVNEEKKSLNSLPALEAFAQLTLSGPQHDPEVARESVQMFETQMAIANQSTPVALILADAVNQHRKKLDEIWAPFIVKLALFGPVPKKESRVLSFAYSTIFENNPDGMLESDPIEQLDLVVQRARFESVVTAMQLCSDKPLVWTKPLIREIFEASAVLDQSSSRSFGLSMAHRQKTRAVELLLLLVENVHEEEFAERIFEFGISCIVDPCQQFSIKLIVEWMLASICLKFEKLFAKLVADEFETSLAAQRIGSMCSWLNVLMLIARAAPLLTETCLDKIVVWCTAQNFPVRCTALAAARLMFTSLDDERRKKWRLVNAIINFDAEPSGNSRRVIDNLCADFYFSKLHVAEHFNFETVLSIIAKRTGMPPEETIPDSVLLERDFSGYEMIASLNQDGEFLKAPSDVYSALSKNATSAPSMENEALEEEDDVPAEETGSSFQRKIVKEKELNSDGVSLIVVASLVDKPNNLGGICRTSEIFGVDTLVVADALVVQDSNFKALSMSSENWQKVEAVKPSNLLPYLQNLRANGYTVIAAEQTTDSVMMHDFVFPKKAVIVMGDEKEGVPVNLLRAVDQTVEIKQVGHTRSLNVHVTAALMIAKFAEQVRFSEN